jgi:coenzyme Q-binding protein COQ10
VTLLRRSIDLPYRPEELFDLVSDVARYPDFIKWIRSLRLIDESEQGDIWKGRAEASVGFLSFSESFVTDVTANRRTYAIDVTLVRGPFRRLKNAWRFTPIAMGAKVDFEIDFVFRNLVLQTLAEANRDHAAKRIIDAFTDEAGRRYKPIA